MTAAREPIHPASPPDCGEEVGGIKKKCPIYVRAFFIGGAGDKYKYRVVGIPVEGPTEIMRYVKEGIDSKGGFDSKVKPKDKNNRYNSYYLGFEEASDNDDINKYVIANIPDATTHVYIVGHSLGGWNGAHLSQILTDNGYLVKMLVTLDPVGTSVLVKINSDIYWNEPKPKAEHWINIHAAPADGDGSDTVANLGGRWTIDETNAPQPDEARTLDINHFNAQGMFDAVGAGGQSPSSRMEHSILKIIQ